MSHFFLRPNTFILLILRSCKNELSGIEGWGKPGKGLTKPSLLLALLHMVDPSHAPNRSTLSQYFSQFMNGSRPDSSVIPLNNPAFQNRFQLRMASSPEEVLAQMDNFCRTYLKYDDPLSMQQLVSGLSIAIYNDPTIPGSTVFQSGFGPVTKAELKDHRSFILQPFLLSVWFYLVTEKPNVSEAEKTYADWTGEADPNTAPPITTSVGFLHAGEFSVTIDLSAAASSPGPDPAADSTVRAEVESFSSPASVEDAEPDCEHFAPDPVDRLPRETDVREVLKQNGIEMNNYGNGPQIGVNNGPINIGGH